MSSAFTSVVVTTDIIGCCASKPRVRMGRKRKWSDSDAQPERRKLTQLDGDVRPVTSSLLCWKRTHAQSFSTDVGADATSGVDQKATRQQLVGKVSACLLASLLSGLAVVIYFCVSIIFTFRFAFSRM